MAVIAPSSGVVALEKEMIDAESDAADIHTLPEEVLLMVFARVDIETLLRAVHAVCRTWKMAMSCMYVTHPHRTSDPVTSTATAAICSLTHTPFLLSLRIHNPSSPEHVHMLDAHQLTNSSPGSPRCPTTPRFPPGAEWSST
jgi:hypothetical protein